MGLIAFRVSKSVVSVIEISLGSSVQMLQGFIVHLTPKDAPTPDPLTSFSRSARGCTAS